MADDACALFSGDTFHHPLQLVDPTMQFGGGDDLALATASRQRLIELAALRDALIIPAHLPWPHGITVRLEHGHPVFTAGSGT